MIQDFTFEESIESSKQLGLKEIYQCDYVQNVFEKIEKHAVTHSKNISKLIFKYMIKRHHLQKNIVDLQNIVLHVKKKQKLQKKLLKVAKEFGGILTKYLEFEFSLWKIWSKKLSSKKIQLCEAFPFILKELSESYEYLDSINKDVTDTLEITYKYV